jgi:hypothetical protein
MDPVKVKGIAKWAEPRTVNDVQSFLGFCNFYRAFIPHFSNIARPLNNLTKKNYVWNWGTREQEAFNSLNAQHTQSSEPQTGQDIHHGDQHFRIRTRCCNCTRIRGQGPPNCIPCPKPRTSRKKL